MTKQQVLPADATTVAAFIKSEAANGRKFHTIERAVTAIRFMHTHASQTNPSKNNHVVNAMRAASRTNAKRQNQKIGIRLTQTPNENRVFLLRPLLAATDDTPRGLHGRLILSFGFALGIRGSKLIVLDTSNVCTHAHGGQLFVEKRKTEQGREGAWHPISQMSVGLLACWPKGTGFTAGPLFRRISKTGTISTKGLSTRSVNNILKRLGHQADYPEKMSTGLSSHSFASAMHSSFF